MPWAKKSTAKQVLDTFGEGQYLSGKTAIVTGGNSGIGLETCKTLSSAGCRVILCSRSVDAGNKAIQTEITKPGEGKYIVEDTSNIVVKKLDLEDLSSVDSFATDILSSEGRIDFLVLNAGIMALPNAEYTAAGFERQIGVNHFGHAYLTLLLLNKMKNQDFPNRIVVLASTAHTMADGLDVNDLHYKKGRRYSGWGAYGQSKLANVLFAKSLGDKLKGTNTTAVSLHPGVISTNLWRASSLLSLLTPLFTDKNIPQGAATTVWACLAPRVAESDMRGAYLSDCGPVLPNEKGQDLTGNLREALWIQTCRQLQTATGKEELLF